MRRRHESQNWSCLHGGASCSVMALVDGRLLSANVGDSSSLLCLSEMDKIAGTMRSVPVPAQCSVRLCDLGTTNLHQDEATHNKGFELEKAFLADAQANLSQPKGEDSTQTAAELEERVDQILASAVLSNSHALPQRAEVLPVEPCLGFVVTPDHSPEAPTEFERMRRTRCKPSDPAVPELLMVYDSPSGSGSKATCPPIFEVNRTTPNTLPAVTNKGKYYKNVRSEWASLVATPPTARFQVTTLEPLLRITPLLPSSLCHLSPSFSLSYPLIHSVSLGCPSFHSLSR